MDINISKENILLNNGNKILNNTNINGTVDNYFYDKININHLNNYDYLIDKHSFSKNNINESIDYIVKSKNNIEDTEKYTENKYNLPTNYNEKLNNKDHVKLTESNIKYLAIKIENRITSINSTLESINRKLYLNENLDCYKEEKILKKISKEELELIQAISIIPYNREFCQQKTNELNILGFKRRKIEKIIISRKSELKYKENNYLYKLEENNDERRNRLRNNLKSIFDPQYIENSNNNIMKKDFTLHIDFVSDVPKNYNSYNLIYFIQNKNDSYLPPTSTSNISFNNSQKKNISIIGELIQITKIPAYINCKIFFELHVIPINNSNQINSYGWTFIDIFDENQKVNFGFYKLPLYSPPIDTYINTRNTSNLDKINLGLIFIRLEKENNDDIFDYNFNDNILDLNYKFPNYHNNKNEEEYEEDRNLIINRNGELEDENDKLNNIIDNQKFKIAELLSIEEQRYRRLLKGEQNIIKALKLNPFDLDEEDEEDYIKVFNKWNRYIDECTGIKFRFLNATNVKGKEDIKVIFSIHFDNNILIDDKFEECEYFTSNYKTNNKKSIDKANIEFKFEEFYVLSNLKILIEWMIKFEKYIYLLIELKQLKNKEYNTIGYYSLNLKNDNNTLTTGKFSVNLYTTPVPKFPFSLKGSKKQVTKLDFEIEPLKYFKDKMENFKRTIKVEVVEEFQEDNKPKRKDFSKKKKKKKKKTIKRKTLKNIIEEISIDEFFIENTEDQIDKIDYNINGIDIYIDQIRYLPDNITVVKIAVKIINSKYKDFIKTDFGLPDLETDYLNPSFKYKLELRSSKLTSDTYLMIILSTLDSYNQKGEISLVGYCYFPLFVSKSTLIPNNKLAMDKVHLHNGSYQIPVYSENIETSYGNINNDNILKLERIPTCSVLIRINRPQLDGNKLKSIKNYNNNSEWVDEGVWIDKIQYNTAKYNTKYMTDYTDNERDCYIQRLKREFFTVYYQLKKVLDYFDVKYDKDDEEEKNKLKILKLADKKLSKSPIDFINFKYITPYDNVKGFSITIDGIVNQKNPGIFFTVISVNPPAGFYLDPIDTDQTYFQYEIDWVNSKKKILKYIPNTFNIRQIDFSTYTHLFFTIKEFYLDKKNNPTIKDYGFSLLPLFTTDRYIYNGSYQLPIFKGDFNKDSIGKLISGDPWSILLKLATNKDPKTKKYLVQPWDYTSLVVRLKDNFIDSMFNKPFDIDKMIYDLIPSNRLSKVKWSQKLYNTLVKEKDIRNLLPKDIEDKEFNFFLEEAINYCYNIKIK